MNAEEIARVFNSECLPLLTNGMKSGELCEIVKDAGLPSNTLWPIGLAEIGYAERQIQGTGRVLNFQDDPAKHNFFRPLLVSEAERMKKFIYERCRSYTITKTIKARDEETKQRLDNIDVKDAILLLKSLGYRVMKPVTQYEEV